MELSKPTIRIESESPRSRTAFPASSGSVSRLCFKEGEEVRLSKESEKILREKLDKDTYDIITKNDKEVVVKFKLVEIVQEIKQKITS